MAFKQRVECREMSCFRAGLVVAGERDELPESDSS
jgi:hypothetical protein